MKLYRGAEGWWGVEGDRAAGLSGFDIDAWLRAADPVGEVTERFRAAEAREPAVSSEPLLPVGSQEVWAAGVTYLRSKSARMEESAHSASAYDRVYEADRPELFFKATGRRCAGPGEALRLRDDSQWMVPEPELALVVSANQRIVGYTIGDDLSCRDIEGENALYLPQAKVWDKCCAIGPCILVADGSERMREAVIRMNIRRGGETAFAGETSVSRMKRSFEELLGYLFRDQSFPDGVFLLTGTGIVPPDDFSLRAGDEIRMEISEIGRLVNGVV